MDASSFIDRTESERTTLREAVERYQREIVPEKRYLQQERQRIKRWHDHDLSYRTLSSLRGTDFARYRDLRRLVGRAKNTTRLELQVVSHLFEIARKEWGMEALTNPLKNIRKPSGSKARDRRLRRGEFEKLHGLLSATGNPWAAPAFELTIETSLRQRALFGLQWEWLDINCQMLRFPPEARGADNKGVPVVLPLSLRAVALFRYLAAITEGPDMRALRSPYGPCDVTPKKRSAMNDTAITDAPIITLRKMDGDDNVPSCWNVTTLLIMRAREAAASVERYAPLESPYVAKAGTLNRPTGDRDIGQRVVEFTQRHIDG